MLASIVARLGQQIGADRGHRTHYLADWKVVDRVSGPSNTIDDYTGTGIHIGIERSF